MNWSPDFWKNDLDLLCALSEVVMNSTPNPDCYDMVVDQYDIDKELLIVEHNLFYWYKGNNPDIAADLPGCTCLYARKRSFEFLDSLRKNSENS